MIKHTTKRCNQCGKLVPQIRSKNTKCVCCDEHACRHCRYALTKLQKNETCNYSYKMIGIVCFKCLKEKLGVKIQNDEQKI